jgi:hypothetical protein
MARNMEPGLLEVGLMGNGQYAIGNGQHLSAVALAKAEATQCQREH